MFLSREDKSGPFYLPKVKLGHCVKMILPNINSRPMLNMEWLEWQFKQGQDQSYWIERIMQSQDIYEGAIDIFESSLKIAMACDEVESRYRISVGEEISKRNVSYLEPIARFGLLAGLYERASKSTSGERCHPLVVNAIITFSKSIPERDKESELDEQDPLLILTTCWAGFTVGKTPEISLKKVFSQWYY